MKKFSIQIIALLLMVSIVAIPVKQAQAIAPALIAKIIKEGIKKVIKAVDLQVQRLQNKTIWLQNAQKTLENSLSKLKLDDIGDWVERQKNLYKDYYEELAKVKTIIAYYQRIKDITQKQVRLVDEYKRAWNLFQKDKNFNAGELAYMARVYGGILEQSADNMEQIYLVINSFKTQMTDAKRLELINAASNKVDNNYYDLTRFNQQNIGLSMQRARAKNDVDMVRKLYGLN